MRLLLAGANGQLGWEIARLARQEFDTIALSRTELDITSQGAVVAAFRNHQPKIIVNAAAYTAVDQAEKEREKAFAVNRDGALNLARLCSQLEIPLIHFSTDYVFDGKSRLPFDENAPTAPLGVYGQSKLGGEQCIRQHCHQHIILRLSWVFGSHGQNFVKTILDLARTKEQIRVVNDQHGCPTPAKIVAQTVLILIRRLSQSGDLPWGTYHYAGMPPTTWYDFARAVIDEAHVRTALKVRQIIPIQSEEYPRPAQRPMYSVLNCKRIQKEFSVPLPEWRENLRDVVTELLS